MGTDRKKKTGVIREKVGKVKLSLTRFLKIIPERLKKIESAPDTAVRPAMSYRPNALAAVLHPEIQHVRISDVREAGPGVRLYTLVPDRERGTGRLAPFGAGQYVTVREEIGGIICTRPYSIASSPGEASGYYQIAVRDTGGRMSSHIAPSWVPGAAADISGPEGEFTYEKLRDAPHVVAVAGGVGITPFRSMIRSIVEGSSDFTLSLIACARTEADILFRDELKKASGNPAVDVRFILSDEKKDGFGYGFVTAGDIKAAAPEDGNYSLFVCGPQAMYRHIEGFLPELGLRRKFIRREVFGQIADPALEPDATPSEKEEYAVAAFVGGKRFDTFCGAGEPLLAALERAGAAVASGCRSGECGLCHSRLVSGECYIPARTDFRREADRDFGYIHPCCAFPRSDIVIELPPAKG